MDKITSRKNEYIRALRLLASDGTFRSERGEYICDGIKTLKEALCFGAEVSSVLWKDGAQYVDGLETGAQYIAGEELFDYVVAVSRDFGWDFGGVIAGHLVGHFPHDKIDGADIESYVAPGSTQQMRRKDKSGNECHWILEVHLVDRDRRFGGFYEELLDLP